LLVVWFVFYNPHVTTQVIWVPLIAVVQFVFVLGITFMVSAITVFYRDVGIVIGHFMRLLFWVSPILWSFTEVAGRGQRLAAGLESIDRGFGLPAGTLFAILSYNPVSILLESYRRVIYGNLGSVTDAEGNRELIWTTATAPNFEFLAIIFVAGMVLLVLGAIVFKRLEPAFAKIL
ncbi:MAG: ABC transporter permease, partial [Chloroflexota bacterium]